MTLYRPLIFVHYVAFMVRILVITIVAVTSLGVHAQSLGDWRAQNEFHTFHREAHLSPYLANRIRLQHCLLRDTVWRSCFPVEGSAFLFLTDVDDPALTAAIAAAIGNRDEGLGAETVDDVDVVERIVSAISTVQVELAAKEFEAFYSKTIDIDPTVTAAIAAAIGNQDEGLGAETVDDTDVVEKIVSDIRATQIQIATQEVETLYSQAITTDPALTVLIADVLGKQDKPLDSNTGAAEAIVRTIQSKQADLAAEEMLGWTALLLDGVSRQPTSSASVGPWVASRTNDKQLHAKDVRADDVLELIRQREEESRSFLWWPPTTVWAAGK